MEGEMPFEQPAMQMVPSLMREENKESDDYEPKVVSLGPYHYGKKKLKFVEDFKPEAVKMFIGGKNEVVFMEKILSVTRYTKSFYLEEVTSQYSNEVFARMMLQDACLILNYIGPEETEQSPKKIRTINHLGTVVYTNIRRDMYLLENQVPFHILKILVHLKYDTDHDTTKGDKLLETIETYCFKMFFDDENIENPFATNKLEMEPPLHLLEIFRRVIVTGLDHESTRPADHCCDINKLVSCLDSCCFSRGKGPNMPGRYVFRSVSDLKSKGIDFRASRIKSLKGVRFYPTKFCQSAMLELPSLHVTMYTKVFFMNMIAYEFAPNFVLPRSVTAYVSFMKLLVVSKKDVKELREKDIIVNSLGRDKQVVQLYNALNTYEAEDSSSYWDVKTNIEKHYNSKVKMWMADFKTNYFDNPWSIIALVGSIVLLILTIIQTYYAGHDNGDNCCSKGKFNLD